MRHLTKATLLLACLAGACGGTETAQVADLGNPDLTVAQHAIVAQAALTTDPDGMHVSFLTQNGSSVKLLKSDIVGKQIFWLTAAGGEPVTNATPIDIAIAAVDADLKSTFMTPAHYAPGPYEVACVIAVSGMVPPNIPAPGDLAAFDLTPAPAGEPPLTGISVRVRITDGDAHVTLGNQQFVRFGNL